MSLKNKFFVKILFLFMPILTHGNFEVQGHRGSRATKPENTLPSFQEALEAGANVLEMDILMTKDEKFIIYHDYFINPELVAYLDGSSLNASPLVYSLTLSEVKQFDCGRKINPLFPKQLLIPKTQIPTLEQLFSWILASPHPNAKKIQLNLEIKREPAHPEYSSPPSQLAEKLLTLVREYGFSERVYYSSFDPEVLFEVRKLDSQAKLGFLNEGSLVEMKEIAVALKAEIISPDHLLIKTSSDVYFLQKLGFKVIPWTVNQPQRWKELILMGVDGLITDYPKDLLTYLYRNNLKNRDFGKKGPQNLHSERGTIAERQGPSENANSEANPTQLKTDSSSCFGINKKI